MIMRNEEMTLYQMPLISVPFYFFMPSFFKFSFVVLVIIVNMLIISSQSFIIDANSFSLSEPNA